MINLSYPSNLPSELQGIPFKDVRLLLPVNPLYTWGQLTRIRSITELTTIAIHHAGMNKVTYEKYDDMQYMSAIARAHINSKKHHPTGSPGFPYDAMVRNGSIYFTNYLEPMEWAVASNNRYTVNICVAGNYNGVDEMTKEDWKALIVAHQMVKAVLPSYQATLGHKEISHDTSCPGFDMDALRADIQAYEKAWVEENSREVQIEKAKSLINEVNWLLGEYKEGKDWALNQLAEQYDFMRSKGRI